jgi:hypothetical protein
MTKYEALEKYAVSEPKLPPLGNLRVSGDREQGFHRIVSNDFRGS